MRDLGLKLLTGAALCATGLAGQAAAQAAPTPIRFGVLAGPSIPTGDFGDGANVGFHLGGSATLRQPTWPVALRADLQWHRFGAKSASGDFGDGNDFDVSGNVQIVPIIAAAEYTFPSTSATRVYVLGGGGAYYSRASVKVSGGGESFSGSASDTKFGFNLGAGITFAMGGRTALLEARLHRVSADEDPETGKSQSAMFVPISFGIRF